MSISSFSVHFLIFSPLPLNFLIFSPFPLHFLILSPLPRSPAARLQQLLQPWVIVHTHTLPLDLAVGTAVNIFIGLILAYFNETFAVVYYTMYNQALFWSQTYAKRLIPQFIQCTNIIKGKHFSLLRPKPANGSSVKVHLITCGSSSAATGKIQMTVGK